MAEVATAAPMPPDVSIAEQRAAETLDAKLARVARENHARAAARQAAGHKSGIEAIAERFMATITEAKVVAHIPRITPEEGDPFVTSEIPADVVRELVPPRFASTSFDTYQPTSRGQHAALKATRAWVDRTRAGDGAMLALIGPTGNGKSHLLYAAANALLGEIPRYPIGCYARPWYKLANELRYGGHSPFAPSAWNEPSEVRALLHRQRIVLIDEVRPTAGTAFDDTELAMFACHAYDARVSVLITSNVSPLADVMGPPAASRFAQVILDGPDWRQR